MAFEKRYQEYEKACHAGKVRNAKTLPAIQLWRKSLSMLFETGHPWLTFKIHVIFVHLSNMLV